MTFSSKALLPFATRHFVDLLRRDFCFCNTGFFTKLLFHDCGTHELKFMSTPVLVGLLKIDVINLLFLLSPVYRDMVVYLVGKSGLQISCLDAYC